MWKYQGPIRKAIVAMKYKYANGVGEVIADKAVSDLLTKDIIMCKHDSVLIPIPAHKRRRNQRGSFKAIGLKGIGKDKQVFLFDDVWTTGVTIKEAAKELKRNGLKNV